MKRGMVILSGALLAFAAFGAYRFPEYNNPLIETLAVVFLSLPALLIFLKSVGIRHGLGVLILLYAFAIAIETTGVLTGFPYGTFSYSSFSAGYRFFDVTPWTVGFAWTPVALGAFVLARVLTKGRFTSILVGTGVLVIYDLVLDPVAVAKGYWAFENGGLYYNVPLSNYFGWFLSSFLAMSFLSFIYPPTVSLKSGILVSLFWHLVFFTTSAVLLGFWIPVIVGIISIAVLGQLLNRDRDFF